MTDYDFLMSMKREVKPYWEQQYLNLPNQDVKLRRDEATGKLLWDLYFEKMVERQNIWYKRTILEQTAPWTDDEIFSKYRFTNVHRELDRTTLHYTRELIPNLKDDEESRKIFLVNVFLFRIFCKIGTWNATGYVTNFKESWEEAKNKLRRKKRLGDVLFTGAYMVNNLKSANKNKETNSDKLENAICIIQHVIDNLDEIYEFTVNPQRDMKSVVTRYSLIPGIGLFNAYEICLDLAITEKYGVVEFVKWTPDYWANVGPGCKNGIDYIFENRGGMSYEQILFFAASVYKSEFERLSIIYN